MPVNKTEAEKHREVQDKPVYRRLCSICVREFYDSLVGPCPERDGRQVCMYCCRMCEHHYTLPGQIGQRCRAKDRARAEKRGGRGTGDPSSAPSGHLPPGEVGDGRRGTIAPSVACGDSSLPEGAGDGSATAAAGTKDERR